MVSPKHRLIKVDSQEFGRCKVPLSPVTVQEEPVSTVFIIFTFWIISPALPYLRSPASVCPFVLRWCPQPQQRWTLTQTTLIRLMCVQTRGPEPTGSPKPCQRTAAATWSHSRPRGSSQVSYFQGRARSKCHMIPGSGVGRPDRTLDHKYRQARVTIQVQPVSLSFK